MQNEAHTSCVSNFAMITENRACHDLCHLPKINRNTEFISGRMRIIPYVSLAVLFNLPVYTACKNAAKV